MEKRKIVQFVDLEAWRKSYALSLEVYKVTENFPEKEKFGITSQLRRAAYSICANIAEGFGRFYFKDKVRFYYQARGSATEVQNFVFLSKGLGFINQDIFNRLLEESDKVRRIINGLIISIEKNSKNSTPKS